VEMVGAVVGLLAILASGLLADRFGRRTLLGASAVLIGVYSGFAPQLLGQGRSGEAVYMILGFLLLGLAFGQSAGAVNASFSAARRYTGAAITSDLAWLIGAGFAPLAALLLASQFGLLSVGAYLLSGAVCTLVALALNKELAK
jgi:MFS family permease